MPRLRVESAGFGAGTKEFPELPNFLRLIVATLAGDEEHDEVTVIETNIDDMNPQVYPVLIERLLAAGAHDAYLVPVVMKKSRPGILLSVMVPRRHQEEAVALSRIGGCVERWRFEDEGVAAGPNRRIGALDPPLQYGFARRDAASCGESGGFEAAAAETCTFSRIAAARQRDHERDSVRFLAPEGCLRKAELLATRRFFRPPVYPSPMAIASHEHTPFTHALPSRQSHGGPGHLPDCALGSG